MAKLDCGEKCIKVDFIDLWCGKDENAFCSVVDQTNGMLDFNDDQHISPLGSLKQAKLMRRKYEALLKTRKEK